MWATEATSKVTVMEELKKALSGGVLQAISGYCTVLTEAMEVISRSLRIDLILKERTKIYPRKQAAKKGGLRTDRETKQLYRRIANEERARSSAEWQRRWEADSGKANWTKWLIPWVEKWIRRKGLEVNYHLTQMLTGHGSFGAFRKRIGKCTSELSILCGELLMDDAEHTLFHCSEAREERENLLTNWASKSRRRI